MTEMKQKYCLAPLPEVERGFARTMYAAKRKDGDYFIYTYGRHVIMRNLADPRQATMFSEHKEKCKVARFSPNGNWVASGDAGGKLLVWGVSNLGIKLDSDQLSCINDIAWDPDSKNVALAGAGSGENVKVVAYDSGNKKGECTNHSKPVLSVDYRPARPYRVITGAEDLRVNFYEGPPFKFKTSSTAHERYPNRVQYSPDGAHYISIGSDSKIIVYEGKDGEQIKQIENEQKSGGHAGAVYSMCWSPDSKQFMTCSADKTCKIWDLESGKVVTTFTVSAKPTVDDMQMSCLWHGEYILSLSLSGAINYWDPAKPDAPSKVIHGHTSPITASVSDITTGRLYTGDRAGRLAVWNDGEATWFTGKGHGKAIGCMAVSCDGSTIWTGGYDDKIMCHETKSQEFSGDSVVCGGRPVAVAASKKQADLAVAVVAQGKIVVLRGGKAVGSTDIKYKPTSVAISPDDTEIMVGGDDKQVRFYSLDKDNVDAKEKRVVKHHLKSISQVNYSPDGATTSSSAADLRILCCDDKGEIKNSSDWEFHTSGVTDHKWSPDGKAVVSVANDLTIFVWLDTQTFKTKKIKNVNAQMDSIDTVNWLSNTSFATSAGDGSIKVWEIA